ncbi:MAG: flavoprotein, partial [Novosphingobium sp.]
MFCPRILLIVGGGISAYKACELVRLIRKGGGSVTCVLTEGGSQFVTAMSLAALSENAVHTTLWDLRNESEMGHIQLSRESDLLVVCPATADLLARMAAGIADDLATTLMLATDKPVMAVPAMNVRMWQHAATQRNVQTLREAGCLVVDPDEGEMACGEFGPGRLPEPTAIWDRITDLFTGPDALPMLGPVQPEEDHDSDDDGMDIAGMMGSLIARSGTRKAPSLDDDVSFDEMYLSETSDFVPPEVPTPGMEEVPVPASSGVTARKGRAKAAPPTDPQAINHTVTNRQSPPQPIPGDLQAVVVEGGDWGTEPLPVDGPLQGKHVLITAGPTHEPIDPVR